MAETVDLEQHLRTIKRRLAVIEMHLERAHERDRLLAETVQFLLEKLTADEAVTSASRPPESLLEKRELTREEQENQRIGAWLINQFSWEKVSRRMIKDGFIEANRLVALTKGTQPDRLKKQRIVAAQWVLTKKPRATLLSSIKG